MIGFTVNRHKWYYSLTIYVQIRRLEWYRTRRRMRMIAELAQKAAVSTGNSNNG